jgi:single-stranded-DNA-specific exonuclease
MSAGSFNLEPQWVIVGTDEELAAGIASEVGISDVAARLLVNRGIKSAEEAEEFLTPSLDNLHDPMLLPDIERGVERLERAIDKKERILVHGDYDVDGVTSTALIVRTLRLLGADVHPRLPHRRKEGYGIKPKVVDEAREEGVSLIITTDCGITAFETVKRAKEHGIDVIITDHHEPGDRLPEAAAVIDPLRKDSRYPFPYLAGVGVALKFAQALIRRLGLKDKRFNDRSYVGHYLDLASLGTIADVVPLTGENRIIARFGLKALGESKKIGIRTLVERIGLAERVPTSYHVGYILGPRINAVGRMGDAALALDLMLTGDERLAVELVEVLERYNRERQQEQAKMLKKAEEIMGEIDLDENPVLVIASEDWNTGVVGIVAGRLVDVYYRPSVVLSLDRDKNIAHGSARSIDAFNMIEALNECSDILINAGGHAKAAGLTLPADKVDEFRERLADFAAERISPEDLMPRVEVEAELRASEITESLQREIERMEPFGECNPEPMFVTRGLEVAEVWRVGQDGAHLKMRVLGDGTMLEAIAFGRGEMESEIRRGSVVDLCYTLKADKFNGSEYVQMTVEDMKPH